MATYRNYTIVMNDKTEYKVQADDLDFFSAEGDHIEWLDFQLEDGTTVAAFNAANVFAVVSRD